MRSCDEILELISAALDGALTADEQTELDEHLSRCPACSALFDELKSLREASAELEDVPAPDGFAGRVMDAIAAAPAQEHSDNVVPFPAKKRSRTPWKGWAATAAVVAVVALGAVTLPGQLGASSDSSAADYAAPSLAQAESNGSAAANSGGALADADRAVPESFFGAEKSTSAEPQEASDLAPNLNAASLPASCGTITLTGEALPAGLEDYACTEDETGTRTYEVPADFFFACLKTLETEQPDGFSYEAGQEDAGYGRIVVREGDAR